MDSERRVDVGHPRAAERDGGGERHGGEDVDRGEAGVVALDLREKRSVSGGEGVDRRPAAEDVGRSASPPPA